LNTYLSLLHAIIWICDLHFENVDFLLDLKIVVNDVNLDIDDATNFGYLLLERKRSFIS